MQDTSWIYQWDDASVVCFRNACFCCDYCLGIIFQDIGDAYPVSLSNACFQHTFGLPLFCNIDVRGALPLSMKEALPVPHKFPIIGLIQGKESFVLACLWVTGDEGSINLVLCSLETLNPGSVLGPVR